MNSTKSIDNTNRSGSFNEWVWVPYDCHYYLFSPEEILFCSEETKVNWIHTMGI